MASQPGRDARFTTMFDLYGLPSDFPGRGTRGSPVERAQAIEVAMAADLGDPRFVPYIQVHEYEALLLVEPKCFAEHYVEQPDAVTALVAEVAGMAPETINDGPTTAPSKRIAKHFACYEREKPVASVAIAQAIGLHAMRAACPHFAQWLDRLERLADSR